jgi:hypothetical protein
MSACSSQFTVYEHLRSEDRSVLMDAKCPERVGSRLYSFYTAVPADIP